MHIYFLPTLLQMSTELQMSNALDWSKCGSRRCSFGIQIITMFSLLAQEQERQIIVLSRGNSKSHWEQPKGWKCLRDKERGSVEKL